MPAETETLEEKAEREKLEAAEAEKKRKREHREGIPDLKRVTELEERLKVYETKYGEHEKLVADLRKQLSDVQALIKEGKKDKHVKNVLDEIAEWLGI